MFPNPYRLNAALSDFRSARQRAGLEEVLARVRGRSNDLLSYDEVAEKLRLRARSDAGIQSIPVAAIIGSAGRYTEFTRTFLPRNADDKERWARVKAVSQDPETSFPPIEVYKVGEAYFVIDGNHRVSIARQEGTTTIEAHVIEVKTNIPLTPDIQPDELIIKAEYAEFLDATHIMDLRPNVDLSMTACCQYEKLMEQICVQECTLEKDFQGDIPFVKAVEDWYDHVYIPLAEAIRDRGLLRWFPNRTITDLYLWISENRSALEKELGWELQSDIAATDLILARNVRSEPGSWRKARTVSRYTDGLFADILVPLSGEAECWDALEQAILIAQREGARLHGLHVVDSSEKVQGSEASAVQAQFDQTCAQANIEGTLVVEAGNITRKISERQAMMDLMVLKIAHPPTGGLSTLKSALRSIITNASCPVLGIPQKAAPFQRALLAYDGTELAKEALFVATYLAEMWKTGLTIFTALESSRVTADVQDHVRRYLEIHEVEAEYVVSDQNARADLMKTVEERNIDLVLMGSHGGSVWRQIFVGSTLDFVLRESQVPVFICR
ncbi:MAG: universal stress protein [Anaerolineales bacterium]